MLIQDDPDMEEFFKDVRKGGMAAMAPYMVNQVPALSPPSHLCTMLYT